VRLAASTLVIIASFLASQVHAKEISTQPLTGADCDKAGMAWNDAANVCAAAQGLEAFVEALFAQRAMSQVSDNQPLTRPDCDKAGMPWNDTANVCEAATQAAEAVTDVTGPVLTSEVTDTVAQTLTREDCAREGMAWNDTANVCGAAAQAAEARPEPEVAQLPSPTPEIADAIGQPLTRHDCDSAAWPGTTLAMFAEMPKQAPSLRSQRLGKVAKQPRGKTSYRQASRSWKRYKNHYADSFPHQPRRVAFSDACLVVYNSAAAVCTHSSRQSEGPSRG
jgi:hypothetical protein